MRINKKLKGKRTKFLKKTNMSYFILIIFVYLSFGTLSCNKRDDQASLVIKAINSGSYEIYKIDSKAPPNFVSQHRGNYNKPLSLTPGNYLILTRCSHQTITLEKNKNYQLVVHSLLFIPPHLPKKRDDFFLECKHHRDLYGKQKLNKHFELKFFPQQETIKVGQKNLDVDFTNYSKEKPQKLIVLLSAIKVVTKKNSIKAHYFIKPKQKNIPTNQAQKLNSWQFLIPDKYLLTLNGTQKEVTVTHDKNSIIETSSIQIKKPTATKENNTTNIWGRPFAIYLNDNHRLFFDETIAIFDGSHSIKLDKSEQQYNFAIKANESRIFKPKSLLIDSGCKQKDWKCLGKKEVLLYSKETAPFYRGTTDVSLLYFQEPLAIGFNSTKGIKYWITTNKTSHREKIATLIIKPIPTYKPGFLSEFTRLETKGKKITGFSQDIRSKKESKLDLIAGAYLLTIYLRTNHEEIEKNKITYKVKLKAFEKKTKEIPYYISEKKYLALKQTKVSL